MLTKEELQEELKQLEPNDINPSMNALANLKTMGIIISKKHELKAAQLILGACAAYRILRNRRDNDVRSNETQLGSDTVSNASNEGDRSSEVAD